MVCNVEAIERYNFTSGEKLFLDANIWQSIYGIRKPTDTRAAVYSQALLKMLLNNCQIYVDVLVVSEFINVYAKDRWATAKNKNAAYKKNFKSYRNSNEFEPVAQEITDSVKRILRHCTRTDSGFASIDATNILSEYALGKSDFSDHIFTDLCQRKKWKLVTDDGDFLNYDVHIITANRRLLS